MASEDGILTSYDKEATWDDGTYQYGETTAKYLMIAPKVYTCTVNGEDATCCVETPDCLKINEAGTYNIAMAKAGATSSKTILVDENVQDDVTLIFDNVKIEKNVIGEDEFGYGIESNNCNLTIQGTLDVKTSSTYERAWICGIDGGGNFTISGKDTKENVTANGEYSFGIYAPYGNIIIEDGVNVTVESDEIGTCAQIGDITISAENTAVVAKGGNIGFCTSNNDIIIKDGAKVNATGSEIGFLVGNNLTITGENTKVTAISGVDNMAILAYGTLTVDEKLIAKGLGTDDYTETLKLAVIEKDYDGDKFYVSCFVDEKDNIVNNLLIAKPAPTGSTGGSSKPTYGNNVESSNGGSVMVTPKNAHKGTEVWITPKADEGFKVDEVIIDGGDVKVTDHGDGTFSYIQPAGKVDIEVTFEKTEEIKEEVKEENLTKFEDVKAGAWYEKYVAKAVEAGIMQGNSDTEFAPNATTTRAMMVTVLFNKEGKPATANDGETWYSEAKSWAMEAGISDGTNMANEITREQLVTMLFRYAMTNGEDTSAKADLAKFADDEKVSEYAVPALEWAVAENIINGDENSNLNPQANATRAELAKIMVSYLD